MRGRAAPPHPGIYRVPPRACNYTNKAAPGPKRLERNTYYRRGTLFIITFYWKFSCLFSKLSRSLSEFFPLFDFTEIAIVWPSTFFTALGPKQGLLCSQAKFVLTALSSVEPLKFAGEYPEEEAVPWQYQQAWEHFFVVCFLDEN